MSDYDKWVKNVQKPMQDFTGEQEFTPFNNMQRPEDKAISFEIFINGKWIECKGIPRPYGYKFITWEPLQFGKGLMHIKSEKPIRSIKWL